MTKIRVVFFTITLIVVAILGVFAFYYARGYKFDIDTLKFQPNGILVLKSEPDGASVYINGELKTATNANFAIAPGTYDVEVKKDGYFTWYKRLTVEKEIVTQASISLFKNYPSLAPLTLSGASHAAISEDGSKIIYSVLPGKDIEKDKVGLWVLDTFNLPLGFGSSPKRITDGDMTNASYVFSPDSTKILLNVSNAYFLLNTDTFTAQNERVNISSQKSEILSDWEKERGNINQSSFKNLPAELIDILSRKSSAFIFSPDDNMIAFTASGSAKLSENLIKPLPGASTQAQERNIEAGRTYVYDIKEDRNFLITDQPITINNLDDPKMPALRWMSTGKHLLLANPDQVIIMDYDGTNRQVVYSGSYAMPSTFPYSNTTKLLILTNLGALTSGTNLYTLTVK